MDDELNDIFEAAQYKEIASEAFYLGGQRQTDDPGARALMQELAGEEHHHIAWIKQLRSGHPLPAKSHIILPDLRLSEYLAAPATIDGAGLQEVLLFAMHRELQAIDFYARFMSIISGAEAKQICQRLVEEELRHKFKLEVFYDGLFYAED